MIYIDNDIFVYYTLLDEYIIEITLICKHTPVFVLLHVVVCAVK